MPKNKKQKKKTVFELRPISVHQNRHNNIATNHRQQESINMRRPVIYSLQYHTHVVMSGSAIGCKDIPQLLLYDFSWASSQKHNKVNNCIVSVSKCAEHAQKWPCLHRSKTATDQTNLLATWH